jgi:hypothetical protein
MKLHDKNCLVVLFYSIHFLILNMQSLFYASHVRTLCVPTDVIITNTSEAVTFVAVLQTADRHISEHGSQHIYSR